MTRARAGLLVVVLGMVVASVVPRHVTTDVNGRPVDDVQAPVRAWTLWYEPEGEGGEDCETAAPGCAGAEAEGQDVLMRGPSYETESECWQAGAVLRSRVSDTLRGDMTCRPSREHVHLCAGEADSLDATPVPCR